MYDKQYYQRIYQQNDVGPNTYSKHVMECCLSTARVLAEHLKPKTVLDFGCGLGYLVVAFRALGVDAYGFDVSEDADKYRLASAKPFCWVQDVYSYRAKKKYDLVTCIEVVEHIPEEAAWVTIGNMCQSAQYVAFSSDQEFIDEPTHINVHEQEYWDNEFLLNYFWEVNGVSFCPKWGKLYEYH